MKALLHIQYGHPTNLKIADSSQPEPNDDEVLIRVHATSVNDWDWSIVIGKPFYIRLLCGLFKPKVRIPGVDVSGEVVSVGKTVSQFKVGDEVYGDLSEVGFGGFAEYVCVPPNALTQKPASLPHHEAAAIPHAAILALQALKDVAQVAPGQSLLINGAGGGVGTFGVQLANAIGLERVDGVDSASKAAMMKSLGFKSVVDYQQQDFTRTEKKYDVVLDTKTNRPPWHYLRALNTEGVYVTVGGSAWRLIQLLLFSPLLRLFTGKRLAILALKPNQGMDVINQFLEAGKLKPIIDGPYPFTDVAQAIKRFGDARHLGKVVLVVRGDR